MIPLSLKNATTGFISFVMYEVHKIDQMKGTETDVLFPATETGGASDDCAPLVQESRHFSDRA